MFAVGVNKDQAGLHLLLLDKRRTVFPDLEKG